VVALCAVALVALAIESNHDLIKLNMATVEAENRDLLGNAYLRKGKLDLAAAEYQKAVAADPRYGRGYNNIGTVLSHQRRYSEAEHYFTQAIQLDNHIPEPYVNLSICYSESKKFDHAVTVLETAKQKFPDSAPVHYYLSMAYVDVVKIDSALSEAEEALELDPVNPDYQRLVRELRALPELTRLKKPGTAKG
jgi:tetratricopeptide (TPR) repeat protein